jgi:hypothetical protein
MLPQNAHAAKASRQYLAREATSVWDARRWSGRHPDGRKIFFGGMYNSTF